jgi:phage terminase large subunit
VRVIEIDYCPRPAFVPFHDRKERWACLVVHRRGGKTVAAINDLVKRALLLNKPSPRFAYVAPTYSQAKDVAWEYLKKFTAPIPGVEISESELHVTMPGDRRVRLYGADNYDRLRGIYLDGCVVDEPADIDAKAWVSVIRPALSDRDGWCVWIGTPKGRDDFYAVWKEGTAKPEEWFTMRLPASESRILPQKELDSAKRDMAKIKGAYEREYECSFETPIHGAVYGDIISELRGKGRVRQFEYDRSYPIFSSFDLGWNDATSVWVWQVLPREVLWLWHTRQQGKTAAEMAHLLRSTNLPIGGHFLPHDATSKAASTGLDYRGELQKAGLQNLFVVPRTNDIWVGINQLRDVLASSSFASPYCDQGLEALEAYHTKDTSNGSVVSKEPVHDWSSHDADAARIMAEAKNLNMIRTHAARAKAEVEPRYPDGSMVIPEIAMNYQRRKIDRFIPTGGPSL